MEVEHTLATLPEEVFLSIVFNLEKTNLLSIFCVCKDFACFSEYYFKRIVKHLYGKSCSLIFPGTTWRWIYYSKQFISDENQAHFTGVGKKKLFRNDTYEGDFVDGMCNGNGSYHWAKGDKYVGQWKNGFQDGLGTLLWKGGNKYEGGWKNGLRHGTGVYSWEVKGFNFLEGISRDTFEGTWINGVRQGQGKYRWANGNTCEGIWQADTRVGGSFYEKLSDRHFYAPNVDSEGAEVNLDFVNPIIQDAYKHLRCTYSVTGTDYYFQYLWETTHEMPFNGVCVTCRETCVVRNEIALSHPHKFIFGGKFVCPCGAGYYKHPCRAMGLFDPQKQQR